MVPEVYEIVLADCCKAITPLFPIVKAPIEAPEKMTFGDIDILVSLEGSSFTQDDVNDPQKIAVWIAIEKALKAVNVFQEGKLVSSKSIAIPWPIDLSEDVMAGQVAVESAAGRKADSKRGEASSKAVGLSHEAEPTNRFIQVDIQLCSTNQELRWRVFKHDHGDMWNILGAIIRPYGLTANEEALYIRIPEIEQADKKRARVFLTNCPPKALEFILRDQQDEWTRRFSSIDALFDYTSRCKWFHNWLSCKIEEGNAGIKDSLKSNDRQRMSQRPIFARWAEEYVPKQIALNRSSFYIESRASIAVRDEVRAAAFDAFPHAEERYIRQLAAWNKEKARIFVKNKLIKDDMALPDSIACALPVPQEGSSVAEVEKNWRGVLRSALTKLIVDQCGGEGMAPPHVRDKYGVLIIDEVRKWIAKNWEAVGRAAWTEQCARAAESMRSKQARLQSMEETKSEGNQPHDIEEEVLRK
ncbi:hypothetical protein N0V93_003501 [Gnomoniopsis smithogilvyi]|uniref:Uncharacterized protein n=1 Tax=Gnomoniopsis smithogilvyi TaxID=1191159 RepID=A0A9W8YYH3_9PEZI|nr:hypothetical protein N0V93_003501 [Gnomoniopsis smithogilvyi]